MMQFLKVFEDAEACSERAGGILAVAGRAAAYCILIVLFALTIYTLW